MAIVRKLQREHFERVSEHTEVDATYAIIKGNGGNYLQIDTYGSKSRQVKDAKSQSIRFSPEAIEQLKGILEELHN